MGSQREVKMYIRFYKLNKLGEPPKGTIGKGLEICPKPFSLGCQNKKRTIGFHVFNRNRVSPKPKYQGLKLFIGEEHNIFWIEITILNVIASLRIDTQYHQALMRQFRRRRELEQT